MDLNEQTFNSVKNSKVFKSTIKKRSKKTKNEKNLEAIMEKDEYKEHPLFGNPRSEEDHTHHYLG